jgi:hypothetical protein
VPTVGRFLQTDPVPGGSANAYDYGMQDPIGNSDLSGECTAKIGAKSHSGRGRAKASPGRRNRRATRTLTVSAQMIGCKSSDSWRVTISLRTGTRGSPLTKPGHKHGSGNTPAREWVATTGVDCSPGQTFHAYVTLVSRTPAIQPGRFPQGGGARPVTAALSEKAINNDFKVSCSGRLVK